MTEENLILTERIESQRTRFYAQVDILKAAMIFLVIFDHTVPWTFKNYMFVDLWERISIPIFLVIMGFNMGLSFNQLESRSLKNLYSYTYFKKKFWRYIYPFIVLLGLSMIIGTVFVVYYDYPAFEQYRPGFHFSHIFLGILQFWGPGNWFIPVIFLSILIMPLLYKGLSGKWIWRIFTIIICVCIELVFQISFHVFVAEPILPAASWGEYFAYLNIYHMIVSTPFFLLSGIGLGMWFSTKKNTQNLFELQNLFIWIIGSLSLVYIVFYRLDKLGIVSFDIEFIYGDYNFLFFPYSAFLFLLILKILPKEGKSSFTKAIRGIGKATYHILLTQILYFAVTVAIWEDHYNATIFGVIPGTLPEESQALMTMSFFITNSTICVSFGVLWWYCESKVRKSYLKRKDLRVKKLQKMVLKT